MVTGPDEGVFLVSGRLEGSIAVATFAFTNTTATPTPALAPTAVKVAVQDAIRNQNEVIGLTSIVHGPVWVPAGTVVASATSEIPSALVEPFVTEQASWVLWADDFPFADFGHAVRLFTIPAGATAISLPDSDRTRSVRWWPIVRLPGQTTATPLLVPEPESIEAEDIGTAALTNEGSSKNAPADHCAILVHGPNLSAGQLDIVNERAYLLRNDLVNRDRILLNTTREGGKLRYDPTSKNEFDRLVKAAAGLGCKKLYLMIAAHGNEPENGGGLVLQSDQNPAMNAILSYEEYATILQQLGNIELCVLQISCFSGGALAALQGRGFTGSVISASNTTEPAYHDGTGHFFLQGFIRAKENSAAAGSDGKVSDQEALDYVNQNETSPFTFPNGLMVDRIQTAMPQGMAVQPTGTRSFTTRMVYASAPGGSGTLTVMRPLGTPNNQPFNATLQITNSGIATGPANVTIPAGSNSTTATITGVDCGISNYTLTGSVGGQAYQASNIIQIGHFKPSTKKVVVTEGSEVEVTLELFGPRMVPADKRALPAADFVISSANTNIAEPDNTMVSRSGNSNEVKFKVKGLMAGMKTTFDVFLLQQRVRKTIDVEVVARDTRQSMNFTAPFDRNVAWSVIEVFNVFNHPIQLPGVFDGTASGPAPLRMTGGANSFVPMTGDVDVSDGTFTVSGNSGSSRIAGFPNVPATATGSFHVPDMFIEEDDDSPNRVQQTTGDSGTVIDLRYTLGAGVFPGGPIEWNVRGVVTGTCGYGVFPDRREISALGAEVSLTVETQPGCPWSAMSSAPWLTIQGTASGLASGAVSLIAAPNPGADSRSATITVADATTTLTQDGSSAQRPAIARFGVVNGASFAGATASGTWITIVGTNLSSTTRIWGDADFSGANLPRSLDGVSVTINGRPAYIFFISPGQLNVLAPDDAFLGAVEIIVTTAAGSSDPAVAPKLASDPALFEFDPEGRRYAAAVHADGTFLGKPGLFAGLTTRPAKAGDVVLLFGTGFGATNPPTPTGLLVSQPAPLAIPVVVRIGGIDAEVLFAGITGSGLFQFNVVVPAGLAAGDHLVEIFIDSIPTQADVSITVEQ